MYLRVESPTKANADHSDVMVKFCEMKPTSKPLLILIKNFCMTEIKSNWLIIL